MEIVDFFVSKLKEKKIDTEAYSKKGYSKRQIKEIIFACNPIKKKEYPSNLYEDPLLYFLYCYKFDLEPITFFNVETQPYLLNNKYYVIGDFDRMPIGIDMRTKEVVLLDYSNKLSLYCSINSETFLMAMLEAVDYYLDINPNQDDINFLENLTRRCAEIAGGEKYLPFYKLMFLES